MPLPSARRQQLEDLCRRLGFSDPIRLDWELLDQSLVHPSLDRHLNNDRLEFLGDAILRILATQFLYTEYPDLSVGDLSIVRSDLISDAHLAELADLYGLDRFLLLGADAQQDSKGRIRRLADAFEAVLSAFYLSWGSGQDAKFSMVKAWLEPHFRNRIEQVLQDPTRRNPKAALQELTQRIGKDLPDYRVVQMQEMPPLFSAEIWYQGRCWGVGEGSSKKGAEMAAARIAFQAMNR